MKEQQYNTLKAKAGSQLPCSWEEGDYLNYCLGRKNYNTIVGVKAAVVYLYPSNNNEPLMLRGSYVSEGRNCIDSIYGFISANATNEQIDHALTAYLEEVDLVVSKTYAMRLQKT